MFSREQAMSDSYRFGFAIFVKQSATRLQPVDFLSDFADQSIHQKTRGSTFYHWKNMSCNVPILFI